MKLKIFNVFFQKVNFTWNNPKEGINRRAQDQLFKKNFYRIFQCRRLFSHEKKMTVYTKFYKYKLPIT